ncbi:MAG: hypothetical protein LBO03_04445 [Acidaminococcales bacterium]|jgi:hypothetical protein|nr:hypothetical protein [Acidaminococcales bacterium]
MTEVEKIKFLKKIQAKKQLSRLQIGEMFGDNSARIIQCLIGNGLIKFLSEPSYKSGCLIEQESDLFAISNRGIDAIADYKERLAPIKYAKWNNFRSWMTIVISLIALAKSYEQEIILLFREAKQLMK